MKNPARFIPLFILSSGLMVILAPHVLANTSVIISGNGEGSKAKVNIRSNSSSTTHNNTSTESNRTEVKINVNGEEQTFSSDKNEDVSMESSDGSVKVNIQNNSSIPNVMQTESVKSNTIIHASSSGKNAKVHVNVKSNTGGKRESEIKIHFFDFKGFFERLFLGLFSTKTNA